MTREEERHLTNGGIECGKLPHVRKPSDGCVVELADGDALASERNLRVQRTNQPRLPSRAAKSHRNRRREPRGSI